MRPRREFKSPMTVAHVLFGKNDFDFHDRLEQRRDAPCGNLP